MREQTRPDVVLVGAGIMSATLGMLLKQLNPRVTMEILDVLAQLLITFGEKIYVFFAAYETDLGHRADESRLSDDLGVGFR
jgi:hypothetical protein